jgi:MFS family permease
MRKSNAANRWMPLWLPLSGARTGSATALLPIMTVVFVAYLVIGLAMPVLPLHVHQDLGLSTFVVGLVSGSQFLASLVSRLWAGHQADRRGAKFAVVAGLLAATASGLLYLLSLRFAARPDLSVVILLLGRALLGAAESFIVGGALNWGLAIAGARNTGKVMAAVGTAMYVAYAVGAPAGTALFAAFGFAAIAGATALVPLLALLIVAPLRAVAPSPHARPAFRRVLGAVWLPAVGLALSSVGFGAIVTFITLLFSQHGWGQAWLALTALSLAFTFGRVVFGHLPDRIGGAKVALVCVLLEAFGQALIWSAPWPSLALLGAVLTGLGYSLVYPGLGVEAVRRAPPESRGLAMGAYTAFLDLALGLASPSLGLVASGAGLDTVYLVSALVVLGAALIAARLLVAPRRHQDRGAPVAAIREACVKRVCLKQTAARISLCAVLIGARLLYAPPLADSNLQMAAANGRFGVIIDAAPAADDLNPYLPSLSLDAALLRAELAASGGPDGGGLAPTDESKPAHRSAHELCAFTHRIRAFWPQRT